MFHVLPDYPVDERHATGVVELLGGVAGTFVHAGEVHIDDAHGAFVAGQPVGSLFVGLDGVLAIASR